MEDKSAVVTGGAGFIGQRLCQRLRRKNWGVIVVDDFSTHDNPQWPSADYVMNCRVQDASFHANRKIDVIFHLAGKVGPVGVLGHKGRIAQDTIDSAAKVADWAEEYGSLVIDISTSEVYGNDAQSNSEGDLPVIQHPSARSEYAVAKLAAEHMLLNRGIDVRIVRPFNVAGFGQRLEGGFVIPRFVRQALDNVPLTVYGDGSQVRSFTHIDDFIDGLALVYRDGDNGEVYNLGNPYNKHTIEGTALKVIKYVAPATGVIHYVDPTELHGPDFREAPDKTPDSLKAEQDLGWEPKRSLDLIIIETILYARGYAK